MMIFSFLMGLLRWCCFSFGLVLVLVYVFSSTLSDSLLAEARSDEGVVVMAFADW